MREITGNHLTANFLVFYRGHLRFILGSTVVQLRGGPAGADPEVRSLERESDTSDV